MLVQVMIVRTRPGPLSPITPSGGPR